MWEFIKKRGRYFNRPPLVSATVISENSVVAVVIICKEDNYNCNYNYPYPKIIVVIAAVIVHLILPPNFSSSRFCSSRCQSLNQFRCSRYRTRKEEGIK
jgi:hypothetical protein